MSLFSQQNLTVGVSREHDSFISDIDFRNGLDHGLYSALVFWRWNPKDEAGIHPYRNSKFDQRKVNPKLTFTPKINRLEFGISFNIAQIRSIAILINLFTN